MRVFKYDFWCPSSVLTINTFGYLELLPYLPWSSCSFWAPKSHSWMGLSFVCVLVAARAQSGTGDHHRQNLCHCSVKSECLDGGLVSRAPCTETQHTSLSWGCGKLFFVHLQLSGPIKPHPRPVLCEALQTWPCRFRQVEFSGLYIIWRFIKRWWISAFCLSLAVVLKVKTPAKQQLYYSVTRPSWVENRTSPSWSPGSSEMLAHPLSVEGMSQQFVKASTPPPQQRQRCLSGAQNSSRAVSPSLV